MSELKPLPCPCCGGEAIWRHSHDEYCEPYRRQYIECTKCKTASGHESRHPDDGLSPDLLKAWNLRQPHPDSEAISESLRFWLATRINNASVSMASSGYEDNELVKAFDSVCESIQQAMEQKK